MTGDTQDVTVTWAMHNLVKLWQNRQGVEVRVVRPVYIYLRELLPPPVSSKRTAKPLLKKHFNIDGVPVIIYPIYKIPKIAYYYAPLYRYLNKYFKRAGFQPDIIVAHYDKSLHIGCQYAKLRRLPFVAGLHITPDLMAEDAAGFTRRCEDVLETASLIACRSGYIYNKATRWFPQYRSKSMIAFSGVEASHIGSPETAAARMKQWKENKNRTTISIITVSSLIQRKKIDTILEALAQLNENIPWTYTIIGEGEDRLLLEELAERLGIRERVRFTGLLPRPQVTEALGQAHIFVLVSELETFGLVYLEAMAAGLVTIGAKNEGIDGIIEHRKNGFLSPAGQTAPLKDNLEHIISRLSPKNLEDILNRAHQTIARYTEEQAATHYLEKIRTCVE
jgi:glycosyltransferase involved in cell wall biosynthesis